MHAVFCLAQIHFNGVPYKIEVTKQTEVKTATKAAFDEIGLGTNNVTLDRVRLRKYNMGVCVCKRERM